ncbi:aldose epimerase family protein [Fibrella aquatilis]|uniref:Aldose 1-epimerase n=1 Tax=Fibrella aquatilis TaxID=2817059 RepID=A0A939K0E4_9BACT|nr:aldose epimerase family protein [Fibrella aquatilis]MBO0931916.1 galactose mutarotase [Fibrella aquatilis]
MAAVIDADLSPMRSFVLRNDCGMRVSLLNYGATITGIWVPDRTGVLANVVLSYINEQDYLTDPYYIGCVVGRFANRIDRGRLPIGHDVYQLSVNESALTNHLHGGFSGFNQRFWEVTEADAEGKHGLYFTYVSPHLEEGYPGTLTTTIHYYLTNRNELIVAYSARTDRPTVVSLTNHSYFNLSAGRQDVRNHTLSVAAADYTPLNDRHLPTGQRLAVGDTQLDLQTDRQVGSFVQANPNCQYCLDGTDGLRPAAILTDPDSGRRLSLCTSAPALQVYGGQYLGKPFASFGGICLEPQYYADAPNQSAFPTAVLEPDAVYQQTTYYRFDVV